nr:PPA1309 family protein [Pseudonocardia acaciae]
MSPAEHSPPDWSASLPAAAREVEDFLAETGWDQPPRLFALVPTAELLAAEPTLADQLPSSATGLTPVAQDPLGGENLAETLAGICWPDEVTGCALAQEIMVLPPEAEAELDRAVAEAGAANGNGNGNGNGHGTGDEELAAIRAAQQHPERRDARLVVAVLRSGGYCCLMRLRGAGEAPDELVEHPDLAPNMVTALLRTLEPA